MNTSFCSISSIYSDQLVSMRILSVQRNLLCEGLHSDMESQTTGTELFKIETIRA